MLSCFPSFEQVPQGEEWSKLSKERQVCLGAQTSLDRLHQLVEMARYSSSAPEHLSICSTCKHNLPLQIEVSLQYARYWSGPMSIAVFAPAEELPLALHYIDYLRRCQPSIARWARAP